MSPICHTWPAINGILGLARLRVPQRQVRELFMEMLRTEPNALRTESKDL